MKALLLAGAVGLGTLCLGADPASNDKALEQHAGAQRLLSEATRRLTDQQDANRKARAAIRNLRNVVGQQESVLQSIENPALPHAWRPAVQQSVSAVVLNLTFREGRPLPDGRKLPAWAAIARDSDGRPALKIEVDAATKEQTKGINNLVFGLPADRVAGKRLVCRAMVKAEGVEKPASATSGGKFVVHYRCGGKSRWPGASIGCGTFDWKPVRFEVDVPDGVSGVFLAFGLQGTTGVIYFRDVKVEAMAED
jgi:hypothetical protein